MNICIYVLCTDICSGFDEENSHDVAYKTLFVNSVSLFVKLAVSSPFILGRTGGLGCTAECRLAGWEIIA